MIVGIDTWNIRGGGGVTHLREVLRAGEPNRFGIDRVIVWGAKKILDQLPRRPWLDLVHVPMLDGPLPKRAYWQQTHLTQLANNSCDLLFVPGGIYLGNFRPFVAMSHNVLPFDLTERRRWSLVSWQRFRFALLQRLQTITFRQASGVIFLSQFGRRVVQKQIGTLEGETAVIPHGIAERFRLEPRTQLPLETYSETEPFRLLYVSVIREFKHQWNVAMAVARLRKSGISLTIDFVGPSDAEALGKLKKAIQEHDPEGNFLFYQGPVAYSDLHRWYHKADAFVFASSCENMPNILLEAMAAGLPIASSDRGPMSEVLGSGGVYFDPEDIAGISDALKELVFSQNLRKRTAQIAFQKANQYSWQRCANETFDFVKRVYAGERS